MSRSLTLKIMVALGVIQGVAGLVRGFNWVQVGSDIFGQGLLLLPMIGAVAVMRGVFIAGVALLFLLFVVGAVLGKSWAWWICLTAVIVNLIVVLSAVVQGGGLVPEKIAWSVIPVILLFYLFSQTGRETLRGA